MEQDNTQDHIERSNTPIERARIFVLEDGSFAVQWSAEQIQNLLSGKYHDFTAERLSSDITDYELNQLVIAGIVDKYDDESVWLSSSQEQNQELNRSYYLNTKLPGKRRDEIETLLKALGLDEHFSVREREDFTVIWGRSGLSFRNYDDVEKARELLVVRAQDVLNDTVVAFVETL